MRRVYPTKGLDMIKPKPRPPVGFFALPVLETLALFAWWGYALTHMIHFPGAQQASENSNTSANPAMFNILLLIVLAASWAAAGWLYWWTHKRGQQ